METDGESSKYPTNKAGAKYGIGYCDAQCDGSAFIYAGATSKIGEIIEPAAPSLIFGKPISKEVFILAIPARLLAIIGAKETSVNLVIKDI